VYGIYQEFGAELAAAGIPNDHAFYGVLRREVPDQIVCYRYPYVRLPNTGGSNWRPAAFVANLVRQADGPLALDEVREKLGQELGVRRSSYDYAIANAPGVLRTDDDRLIYVGNIEAKSLGPIIRHALALLKQDDEISVARIFEDKRAICESLGIRTPRLLYELLRCFAGSELAARNYPTLRLTGA